MALTPGARLGPYEVLSSLGAGGMGEVYRARDTRLECDVAIKVLPETFTSDPDRLARFQREAKVLASLNHPNIAAIYGIEDSNASHALVMELVEGPTLAHRIAQGPIPIEETLPIATQIAEALESAHDRGIVHRDLKPANIKLRPDGTVKMLDFGLAKAMEPSSRLSPDASESPTITTPAMTRAGIILGTAAYMSPEQARGQRVDAQTDMWAFRRSAKQRALTFQRSARHLSNESGLGRDAAPGRPRLHRRHGGSEPQLAGEVHSLLTASFQMENPADNLLQAPAGARVRSEPR
jgi:serine/threonine protein kinase